MNGHDCIPGTEPRLSCGIDLREWDVILINTSAGKDSQVMLQIITDEAKRLGVLDRVVAVHADLGRIEWEGVPELAELQAIQCGVPRFEIVSRPQGDLLDHVRDRGMWPAPGPRYCTSDHKRAQVRKLMTQMVDEIHAEEMAANPGSKRKHCHRVRILNCIGIRANESEKRTDMQPLEFDDSNGASNGRREVWKYYPIFDLTKDEVWEHIHSHDVPYHPAYDLGMPRLSCVFCFFAGKAALALAGRYNRHLLDQYVEVEREAGHTFKKDESIESIRDGIDAGVDFGEIKEWEDGRCA
jgi:3'-phosphoadenosine 5'-phosphosulfate sulfotransferase (PAPS reductase)/FAD synthetase